MPIERIGGDGMIRFSGNAEPTTSQTRPTLPPVVETPSPEVNAIVITPTPIERTPAPPHVTPPSETKKAPTNVITHLWIGWRIEPEVEEFIRRFVEAFTHRGHAELLPKPPPPPKIPPIKPPVMGGAPPGVPPPLPGAPLVIIPPQGTEQKQRVTA